MKRRIIIEISAALLILLFVYTATSKLMKFDVFEYQLSKSPLIGASSNWIAWLLPLVELIVSLLLFFPKTRLKGFYASFILMLGFTIYIGYMLMFTPDRPCSCGGVLASMTWEQHLVFNIFFTFLSALGVFLSNRSLGKIPIQKAGIVS